MGLCIMPRGNSTIHEEIYNIQARLLDIIELSDTVIFKNCSRTIVQAVSESTKTPTFPSFK